MADSTRRELTPTEAVQLYLEDKRTDGVAEQTIKTYRTELRAFTSWCDEQGVESVGEIDGLDMKRYKTAQAADYRYFPIDVSTSRWIGESLQ